MIKFTRFPCDALGFERNRRVSGIAGAMSGRSTSILQPRDRYERRRAMPSFATTVTVQRLSGPDLPSFTEQTTPVTVDPVRVNVAFRPEYWA
jgi:hypothetical protein